MPIGGGRQAVERAYRVLVGDELPLVARDLGELRRAELGVQVVEVVAHRFAAREILKQQFVSQPFTLTSIKFERFLEPPRIPFNFSLPQKCLHLLRIAFPTSNDLNI